MFVDVTFDPIDEVALRAWISNDRQIGAVVTFSGLVRDVLGSDDEIFELEHYPGMTEKMLTKIVNEAIERFELADAIVVHRVGKMNPGDVIVTVMAASRHRQASFDGANFIMDYLKTRAPLWKKEADGTWVSARDADEDAFARWRQTAR